jgi:hypothetical protein
MLLPSSWNARARIGTRSLIKRVPARALEVHENIRDDDGEDDEQPYLDDSSHLASALTEEFVFFDWLCWIFQAESYVCA